jgi:hypothetical protein
LIDHPGARFSPATASDPTERIDNEDDDEDEYEKPSRSSSTVRAGIRKNYGKAGKTTKTEAGVPLFPFGLRVLCDLSVL